MEVVIAIGSKLGEYLVEATINQARYMFCFNSIIEDLEDEESNLNLAKDRIKNEVEREERNTKEIEKDVEKWLKDVDDVMADVQMLKAEIQAKKNCLNGWCPNSGCRYWLSRKATRKTSLMVKLKKSGKFSTVAHPKPLPGIEFSAPRDFVFFEATQLASDQIIEALKNHMTKMVGLYGGGGAGKTTLAKVVGNKLRQQKIFDEVVVAVVSQHPNFINVQNQLAESLGLKLEEVTKEERAKRLYLRFTETKSKILIILDDVWRKHDLKNELGIPIDDNHSGCKILLTTRRKQVCDQMGCNLSILLDILKPEEGLTLLKRHAGIDDGVSTLIDVSKEVAGECKGLPLAIVAVGSALRGKDVDEWKAVSRKLKNAKLIEVDDIDVDVYTCLKLSYDYLNSEDSKLCFLFCSLFPEDFEINLEFLVMNGVGLGWYQGVESIEEARSLLRATIKGLKASSLLLDGDEEGCVKMHDIVRDVALWIGSKEKKFFSKTGIGLTDWPEDEGLEQYIGISLMGNEIKVLPNGLICPNLHILLLEIDETLVVPDEFFEGMKALKVVNIIDGELSLKSFQFLTNLQVLQLFGCRVRDVAFLEMLKTLQILFLGNITCVDEIPKDLGDKLNKLKLLAVEFSNKTGIHPIVLTRFSRLQEFYGRISDWEVEGTRSETRLAELSLPELRGYRIIKGIDFEDMEEFGMDEKNTLRIGEIEAASLVIFSALYQNLQFLHLRGVSGCENIIPSIDQRGLNELTSLALDDCKDLQCIMDASQHEKSWNLVMLSKLAMLELTGLPELQWIWKAPAHHVSLQNLTKVGVSDCNKLTHLFTLSQARSLVHLKILDVGYCERLECIVEAKFDNNEREINVIGGDGKNIALPMLTELQLVGLPNLVSFCSENYYSTWPALQGLSLTNCPHLTVNAEIQASMQYLVESLQFLNVGVCDITPALLKHDLKNLEELNIKKVGVQVVFQQEVNMGGDGLFPSLMTLKLSNLQEMKVLYKGPTHTFIFQNLTTLIVEECNRLGHLLSPTFAQNLLQLEVLRVSSCLELKQIIDDSEDQYHLQPISFPKLTNLEVNNCPKLKRVFHISVAPSLEKLNALNISYNDELEEVFWHKDGADLMDVKEFDLTQLWYFSLYNLPKLTKFCPEGYQFTFPSSVQGTVDDRFQGIRSRGLGDLPPCSSLNSAALDSFYIKPEAEATQITGERDSCAQFSMGDFIPQFSTGWF